MMMLYNTVAEFQSAKNLSNYSPSLTAFVELPFCQWLLARFIWNAKISISIAIHCYERLF